MGKSAKINSKISTGHRNPFKNNYKGKKPNFKNKQKGQQPREKKPKLNPSKWGQDKFVPKFSSHSRDNETSGEAATPWGHFKTDLLEKEKEEAHKNAVNMNTAEAQENLKQREQNYRRTLITTQAKQPTKWEKFNDDDEAEPTNSSAKEHKVEKANNSKFQKKNRNNNSEKKEKNFSGIDLKNFDSKNLSFRQRNNMRKALTKGFINISETSLTSAVRDLKYKQQKKEKKLNAEKNEKLSSNEGAAHKN